MPVWVIIDEPERKPIEIGVTGIRIKTQVEIIKGHPRVVITARVGILIDNVFRIILGVIDTVFHCCLRMVIGHTAGQESKQ